jgi:hypothetical protein
MGRENGTAKAPDPHQRHVTQSWNGSRYWNRQGAHEEPELDGALAILDLFRVFRESGDPDRPGWRFAIARLPDVIRKTEHVGRMLASCRSLLDCEGRHWIPSWGAYA